MSEARFDPQEWLTTAEAAAITGYSRENFVKAKERGLLEAVKRGRMLFFRATDITAYVERMKAEGPQKYTPKIYRQD
jgi:excisionase family DNA binding protein